MVMYGDSVCINIVFRVNLIANRVFQRKIFHLLRFSITLESFCLTGKLYCSLQGQTQVSFCKIDWFCTLKNFRSVFKITINLQNRYS